MAKVEVIDATPGGHNGFSSVYLVSGDWGSALIDAGPSNGANRVLDYMRSKGLKADYIILTHIHVDHGGASGILSQAFDSRVLVHPRGLGHVMDTSILWEQSRQALGPVALYYGEPSPVDSSKAFQASDGDIVDLGRVTLKIIHTPGHASHHMSIYLVEEGLMFTGDSAGVLIDGFVRVSTTPVPLKPKLYIEGLERMIAEKPRRVAVAHYGIIEDGVGYLRWHAEEFRLWLNVIARIVASGITDPIEVAGKLIDKIENARIAANSRISNLYYSTVAGMTRAVLEGEWP